MNKEALQAMSEEQHKELSGNELKKIAGGRNPYPYPMPEPLPQTDGTQDDTTDILDEILDPIKYGPHYYVPYYH